VAGLYSVLRVLPWRDGRRAGSKPSDRLDCPCRTPAAIPRESLVRRHVGPRSTSGKRKRENTRTSRARQAEVAT
jgi:hypothetical protein